MHSYPVMLHLKGKQAVVIGGGTVATRKIHSLLHAEAIVTVVSPEIKPELQKLAQMEQIVWHNKRFQKNDLQGALIIIAATNDPALNQIIATSCHPYQLVNVTNEGKLGNFSVPAVLRRGKLTITVSTEGASPLLAKKICHDLAGTYDETYASYVEKLAKKRESVNSTITDPLERKTKLKQWL